MLEIIVVCLLLILFLKYLNKKSNKNISNKIVNNYSKKSLITNFEKYFYDAMVDLEKELNIKILPQVNLGSIINKNTNNYYRNELFRNIDFGIFTSDYKEILLLIEINDKTHNNKKRIKRDKKVDYITANAGIRLIKFYSNYDNKREYIKERVKNEILKERDKLNISNK